MMRLENRSIQAIVSWVALSASLVACGGKTGGSADQTSAGDGDVTTDSSGGDGDGDGDTTSGGDGDGDTTTSGGGDVTPGGACDVEGEQGNADCNSCTCEGGHWLCTEIGCGISCDPADYPQEGCNPCSCVDGLLLCTDVYCPPLTCSDGDSKLADDGCNTCTCDGGQWRCTLIECEATCEDGDTKTADDGCNTCTCAEGSWACTKQACPELCEEYDTKTADDGCNTCTCNGGFWVCTTEVCGLTACGARAGDTCAETEYCAYEEGQLCGAADDEAVCMARPELCPQNVALVCGCDGKTYSNSCAAASMGTGVLHDGACESEQ